MKHVFLFTTAILGTIVTSNVAADELVDSQVSPNQAQLSSIVNQVETQPMASDAIVEHVQSAEVTQVESQPTVPVVTQKLTGDEVNYALSAETTKAQADFSIDQSQEKPSDQIVVDTTDLYADGRGDKAIEPTLARDTNTTPVKTVTVGNSTRVDTYDINSSYASNDNTRLTTTDKIYTHAAQIQTSARHMDIANHLQGDIEKAYEYSAVIPTWLVADTKAAKIRLDNAFELTKQSGATDHEQLMYDTAVINYMSVINKYNAFMTKQPVTQKDLIVIDASVKQTTNVDKTMGEVYDVYTKLPQGIRQRLGLIIITNDGSNNLGSANSFTGVVRLNSKYFEQKNAALDIVSVLNHELGHIVDGDSFVVSDELSVVNDHYNSFSRSDDFIELWEKMYKDSGSSYHQNQTESFADAFSLYVGYITGKLDSINSDIKDYFESHAIMFSDLPVSPSKALYDGATNVDDLIFEQKSDTTNEVTDETPSDKTDEVTDQVTDEVTDETTDEVTDETTDEVTDETTDEVIDEVTDEVTDETTDEVADETTNETPSEVTDEVTDDTTNETTDDTTNEAPNDITDETSSEVTEEVINETQGVVIDEVITEVDITETKLQPSSDISDPAVFEVRDTFTAPLNDAATFVVSNKELPVSTVSTSDASIQDGTVNGMNDVNFNVDTFTPLSNPINVTTKSSKQTSPKQDQPEKSAPSESDEEDIKSVKSSQTPNKYGLLNYIVVLSISIVIALIGLAAIIKRKK